MCDPDGMASGKKAPPSDLSKEIASILRALIGRHDVKQVDLANAVGISQAQLSGILKAKKHVDVETLDAICWALGAELVDVIREADEHTILRQNGPEWAATAIVRS